MAVHLSDMGIKRNEEDPDNDLLLEVLDYFGIDNSFIKIGKETTNQQTADARYLRNVVKKAYNIQDSSSLKENNVNSHDYQYHLVSTKQGKLVNSNKIINQASYSQGIGRIACGLSDIFVVTRKCNNPELIFNNTITRNKFFILDEDEHWKFSYNKSPTNECFICQKYRYGLIYIDKTGQNEDMVEIKDSKIILEVKKKLKLPEEIDDYAPMICGSVVNGGFTRKLQMLRCDLFSLISVSQSESMVSAWNQSKTIKKGVLNYANSHQFVLMDEIEQKIRGWAIPLKDKTFNNKQQCVQAINAPEIIKNYKNPGMNKQGADCLIHERPCTVFAYATYLPPGLHQFLIYVPGRSIIITKELREHPAPAGGRGSIMIPAKLYCKNIIINLSHNDFYPYIRPFDLDKKKSKTISNVWRKWRHDTEEDVEQAFNADISGDFDAHLFMKEEDDVEIGLAMLKQIFKMLQIVFQEGQALTFQNAVDQINKSYPEINYNIFKRMIIDEQTEKMALKLPIEKFNLAYQRATRGDEGQTFQGTLCRGEFYEIILRLARQQYINEKRVSPYLRQTLEDYIEPIFKESKILAKRTLIQGRKQLNRLLHHNFNGLLMIFEEQYNVYFQFDWNSAIKCFICLKDQHTEQSLMFLSKSEFVYCQMTNLEDLEDKSKYSFLKFVEFLEFICRVSIIYHKLKQENGSLKPPLEIEDKVEEVLQIMWENKIKNDQKKKPKPVNHSVGGRQRKKKEKVFPEYKNLEDFDESDDD